MLRGSFYNRVYRFLHPDWWTAQRKESRLHAPLPMGPHGCVLNVWLTYLRTAVPSDCVHACARMRTPPVSMCERSMCVFGQAQWIAIPGTTPELLRIPVIAHNNKFLKSACD